MAKCHGSSQSSVSADRARCIEEDGDLKEFLLKRAIRKARCANPWISCESHKMQYRATRDAHSLSSLPTRFITKDAPIYLKCGRTCKSTLYQPALPSTSLTLIRAWRSGRRARTPAG